MTWFYQTESELERIIAGISMTTLLGFYLVIILKIRLAEIGNKRISLEGFSEDVTPANQEATEQEISSPEEERIGSSDGTFTINKPPDNWIIEELTLADYLGETISMTDKRTKELMVGKLEIDLLDKVLILKSKNITSVIPIPGTTIINERNFPTAFEIPIFTRVAILSIKRFQPILYNKKTLESNVFQFINPMLRSGLVNIEKISLGKLKNSDRNFLTIELNQKMENAMINGEGGKDVVNHITVIGINGELHDHLLNLNYPTFPNQAKLQQDEDIKILKSLVDSFRPLKIIESENKFHQSELDAEENYNSFIKKVGKSAFLIEFRMLLYRLKDWDMNDPEIRDRAIQQLLPFEIFAKEVSYKDEFLDNFWNSVHSAKKGEAFNFKNQLIEILELLSISKKSKE